MNNAHLLPPAVKDIGDKLSDPKTTSSERFYLQSRMEAIKKYAEEKLNFNRR